MKSFVIFTTIFIPFLVADPLRHDEVCLSQLGLDNVAMQPLLQQVIHPVYESQQYNDFLSCFWQKLKYMDKEGNLYWDDIRVDFEAKFGKSRVLTDIIVNCKKQNLRGNNPGETAVKNQNCLMQGVVDYDLVG